MRTIESIAMNELVTFMVICESDPPQAVGYKSSKNRESRFLSCPPKKRRPARFRHGFPRPMLHPFDTTSGWHEAIWRKRSCCVVASIFPMRSLSRIRRFGQCRGRGAVTVFCPPKSRLSAVSRPARFVGIFRTVERRNRATPRPTSRPMPQRNIPPMT
jgi:hypothetical protein